MSSVAARLIALQSIVALDNDSLVRQLDFVTGTLVQHGLLAAGLERHSGAAAAVFSRCALRTN